MICVAKFRWRFNPRKMCARVPRRTRPLVYFLNIPAIACHAPSPSLPPYLLRVGGASPYHATRSILRTCLPPRHPLLSSLLLLSAPRVRFQPGSLPLLPSLPFMLHSCFTHPSLPFMRPQRFPCSFGEGSGTVAVERMKVEGLTMYVTCEI